MKHCWGLPAIRYAALPDCDAVWLPGGYPELHAARLAGNRPVWASLATHVSAGSRAARVNP